MIEKYDLAISFAGEQRELAKALATRLDSSGYSIFYDEFYPAELFGSDLSILFHSIYSSETRFVLILLSNEYLKKPWTNHERQAAIEGFMHKDHQGLLVLKIDDVSLPGHSNLMGYTDLKSLGEEKFYKILLSKLGSPIHYNQITNITSNDVDLGRQVISACFRRAIFSRMDSEINLKAMYDSINNSIGIVNSLIPNIHNQELQFICGQIVSALDRIERTQTSSVSWSHNLPVNIREKIDTYKLDVVRLLLEIRRAAKIPMQLPFSLKLDHFYPDTANEQPSLT